jgi:hypothetical protein
MMRALLIGTATVLLAGCDQHPGATAVVFGPSASTTASVAIAPQLLACSPFGTSFTLVVAASSRDLFVDNVGVRLGDGSNVGGPMVTFPDPELRRLFGSTQVRAGGTRAFGFQPALACGGFFGRSLFVDVGLVDITGARQTMTVSGTIKK